MVPVRKIIGHQIGKFIHPSVQNMPYILGIDKKKSSQQKGSASRH